MMRFSTLIKNPADWMTGEGADNAIVLTSRIRLARNLKAEPFPGWAKKEQRQHILELLRPAAEALPCMKDAFSQELDDLSSVQKQVLVERHLISREHAARGEGSAAVIERRQSIALMLNEEDHLRMQAIRPGMALRAAYDSLAAVDEEIEQSLEIAFDPDLGYLTTCPTNLGTGLRASSMLHLPALVLSDQIGQVLQAVNRSAWPCAVSMARARNRWGISSRSPTSPPWARAKRQFYAGWSALFPRLRHMSAMPGTNCWRTTRKWSATRSAARTGFYGMRGSLTPRKP